MGLFCRGRTTLPEVCKESGGFALSGDVKTPRGLQKNEEFVLLGKDNIPGICKRTVSFVLSGDDNTPKDLQGNSGLVLSGGLGWGEGGGNTLRNLQENCWLALSGEDNIPNWLCRERACQAKAKDFISEC